MSSEEDYIKFYANLSPKLKRKFLFGGDVPDEPMFVFTPCVISNGLDEEMNMLILDAKGIYKTLKDRFEGGTQDEF